MPGRPSSETVAGAGKTLDSVWGRRLARWLRRHQVFSVLDRHGPADAELCDWTGGGCRVLAETLLPLLNREFPGWSFALKVVASEDCPAEHVVVQVRDPRGRMRYIDGDGVSTEKTLLRRLAVEVTSNVCLSDYDPATLNEWEIQSPPIKRALLAELFETAFAEGDL